MGFLNFLAQRARVYPSFHLEMEAEVRDSGSTVMASRAVRAQTPQGERELRADLVVAPTAGLPVRAAAGLQASTSLAYGRPLDAAIQEAGDPDQLFGRIDFGRIFVMLDRGDYWQCGLVIGKADSKRSSVAVSMPSAPISCR